MDKSENRIQAEIVSWYRNNYCLAHHNPRCLIASVPNGGKRNEKEAMTLKATGLMAGFSDLILIHAKKGQKSMVIFPEIKTPEGVMSSQQADFSLQILNLGYCYGVFTSLEQFQSFIYSL